MNYLGFVFSEWLFSKVFWEGGCVILLRDYRSLGVEEEEMIVFLKYFIFWYVRVVCSVL